MIPPRHRRAPEAPRPARAAALLRGWAPVGALGLLLGALLLAGCAGASFEGGVFRSGEVRYRVGEVGAGWSRVRVGEGQVSYFSPRTGATLSAHGECRRTDAPLRALTLHLLSGFTERAMRQERLVPFAGREALRTSLSARLDGVPLRLELLVLKKDACTFDLVYSAPPERFSEGVSDFERFVAGFEKLPAEGP